VDTYTYTTYTTIVGTEEIRYWINNEGQFVTDAYGGQRTGTLSMLRVNVEAVQKEEARKKALAAARKAKANVVDGTTAYVMGDHWVPQEAIVRSKAARGGWNITVKETGEKRTGVSIFTFDEHQIDRLAELRADLDRLQAQLDAVINKAVPAHRKLGTKLERQQDGSFAVTAGLFWYKDRTGKVKKSDSEAKTTAPIWAEQGFTAHGVTITFFFDHTEELWRSPVTGDACHSLLEARKRVAQRANPDFAKPVVCGLTSNEDPQQYLIGDALRTGWYLADSFDRPEAARLAELRDNVANDARSIINSAEVSWTTAAGT
jgi:hypothetical protein